MSGNIFNSNGIHVGVVDGSAIFDLKGKKLYHLKRTNIYPLSGELVGHLNGAQGSDKPLSSTDKLFPEAVRKILPRLENWRMTNRATPAFPDLTSPLMRLSGGPGSMPNLPTDLGALSDWHGFLRSS